MKAASPTRRADSGRTGAAEAPAAAGRVSSSRNSEQLTDFLRLYRAEAFERVRLVKTGVPAGAVDALAKRMAIPKERLVATLGLARATVDRKVRENRPLSSDDSSRIVGLARLVGQVQALVEESGEARNFDAAAWLARWLEQPLAALGGERPADLMDTAEGQALVSDLIARIQSGAYA